MLGMWVDKEMEEGGEGWYGWHRDHRNSGCIFDYTLSSWISPPVTSQILQQKFLHDIPN